MTSVKCEGQTISHEPVLSMYCSFQIERTGNVNVMEMFNLEGFKLIFPLHTLMNWFTN